MADRQANISHGADVHAEHHGIGRYIVIWLVLLALTGATVVTGRMDFGDFNIVLAMIIASIKATLVVLFFMHLWDGGGVNRLVFVIAIFFVGLLILGVFGDLWFRVKPLLPQMMPGPWNG